MERCEVQKHIFSRLSADKAASDQAAFLLEDGPWAAQRCIETAHFLARNSGLEGRLLIPEPVCGR